MNATFKLPSTQAEADQQLLQLLRLTYQTLAIAVCLTYLAGQHSIQAGRKTREWVHWVDESKIFERPIWEVRVVSL